MLEVVIVSIPDAQPEEKAFIDPQVEARNQREFERKRIVFVSDFRGLGRIQRVRERIR